MPRKFRHPYVAVVVTTEKNGKKTERYRSYERRVDAQDFCHRINKRMLTSRTLRLWRTRREELRLSKAQQADLLGVSRETFIRSAFMCFCKGE
jgi:hypothetical protein